MVYSIHGPSLKVKEFHSGSSINCFLTILLVNFSALKTAWSFRVLISFPQGSFQPPIIFFISYSSIVFFSFLLIFLSFFNLQFLISLWFSFLLLSLNLEFILLFVCSFLLNSSFWGWTSTFFLLLALWFCVFSFSAYSFFLSCLSTLLFFQIISFLFGLTLFDELNFFENCLFAFIEFEVEF